MSTQEPFSGIRVVAAAVASLPHVFGLKITAIGAVAVAAIATVAAVATVATVVVAVAGCC